MLQIRNLSYNIGELNLIQNVQLTISDNRRIALIGKNGAGKTTLLRLIMGNLPPASGDFIKPKNYRIGYLPQEEILFQDGSILSQVMEGNQEIVNIEKQMFQLQQQLKSDTSETLLKKLGELEHRYQLLNGYSLEASAKKILVGLGFSEADFHKSIFELSGGWRMRVYLARLLLQAPDLLLLDEPTNHLDLQSLEWLETYLKTFEGSILLISHDRFFIDRLSQEIFELDQGKIEVYKGNYQFYEKEKLERQALLQQQWEQQQKEIAHQKGFIERFRYKASKASQVQSRVKRIEKLDKIELPETQNYDFQFSIKVDVPSYKDVLKINQLSFRYNTDWVLQKLNLNIYRGEKLALVGVNGAGKTTLTRLIANELHPEIGSSKLGERVTLGYYAQHQVEQLDLSANIYDEVLASAAPSHAENIRDILGLFRFSGNDIYKNIGILSGGEKARVTLAKILLSPVNFLIMDEPTNHLDLYSKQALEHALQEYDGTLLLISHDRYFLDKLVTRVVEISDKTLHQFEGNYSEYLDKRLQDKKAEIMFAEEDKKTEVPRLKLRDQKRIEAQVRQKYSKERNKIEKQIVRLENNISDMEAEKAQLEAEISKPENYENGNRIKELQIKYAGAKKELARTYETWETDQSRLEELIAAMKNELNQLIS